MAAATALPARALLVAENRDKALHVHFIKQEEIEDGLPGWLADRLAAAADGEGRYSLEAGELVRELGGGADRLRSLIGHLARAGVVEPSPAPMDRVAGRFARALRRPGGCALPLLDRRGRAGALAPVPRDLGLRGGGLLPPARDPAPLRRPRGAAAGGAVLRQLRRRRWR